MDLRFLKKVLTDAEIELVENVPNRDAILWLLWAAKETAYKVVRKSCSTVSFLPRRWPVMLGENHAARWTGKVFLPEEGSVFFQCCLTPDYVHCVGSNDVTGLWGIIENVEIVTPEKQAHPSRDVRRCLREALAVKLSLKSRSITIRRESINGEFQPPQVYIGNERSHADISLSHDGRFIAYAFTL